MNKKEKENVIFLTDFNRRLKEQESPTYVIKQTLKINCGSESPEEYCPCCGKRYEDDK